MKKPFVFISYSTKNQETASLVHSYLEGKGISCWIASRNIEGGGNFTELIYEAIEACDAFVMIFSHDSDASRHVSIELTLAHDQKKTIIPFRIEDFPISKGNRYLLALTQWINAYDNMNEGLRELLAAVKDALPYVDTPQEESAAELLPLAEASLTEEQEDETPALSREEIVSHLLKSIGKFPYCLRDKAHTEARLRFLSLSKRLFAQTVSMHFRGKKTASGLDYVDFIVDTLSHGQGISLQVKGLPGCAKNMLLQLAYYRMLEDFLAGESDSLPIYLSSSYYEKIKYTEGKERDEMKAMMAEECRAFYAFVRKNPNVKPVLMVEAVREHVVASFAPEDVIFDVFKEYAETCKAFRKFNRIVAIDVGLIKNKQRLKRTIPLVGDASGYIFRFSSVPITDKEACFDVIETILRMYADTHDGVDAADVYKALKRLRFVTIDVFTVRLVATELSHGLSAEDISIVDMYERLALSELNGDEGKMMVIAHELFEYVFNDRYDVKNRPYNAVLWSLPHKHSAYLEFMLALYVVKCVGDPDSPDRLRVLGSPMTSMENHFMAAHLADNYQLQEAFVETVLSCYDSFNVHQKSNAAYWLGKLSYAELTDAAQKLLEKEYERLLPLVKQDHSQTLTNRYNQYLFRSVCYGLISCGRTSVLDEYLSLAITNDITGAIDRGTVIQYMGDSYRISAHNDFYLDNDPNVGEQAIRILSSSIESKLASKHAGYVETDLVSLLLLVQARMHVTPEHLSYNLVPCCQKCLELLADYHRRPRSIVSDKLLCYFRSVEDDLNRYVKNSRFDAAFFLYESLSKTKDTRRRNWEKYEIKNPESIADHTLNAWLMAMLYLPNEGTEQGYDKQVILDMLLIHDMAEAVFGDHCGALSEPTKELKKHNELLCKVFLKGTYPGVANMTRYYDVWVEYYYGQSINARVARDVNLLQTVCTFFSLFAKKPSAYSLDVAKQWLAEGDKLGTNIGYDLFERIIVNNPIYRKAMDSHLAKSITAPK